MFFAVQACLAAPYAFQVVLNVNGEAAHALDFKLHCIAILERTQAPVVGARRHDIAWLQRVNSTDPFDDLGNFVRHV